MDTLAARFPAYRPCVPFETSVDHERGPVHRPADPRCWLGTAGSRVGETPGPPARPERPQIRNDQPYVTVIGDDMSQYVAFVERVTRSTVAVCDHAGLPENAGL